MWRLRRIVSGIRPAWHNRGEDTSDEESPLPAITVGLPAAMTAPEPPGEIACEAATVGEALLAVVAESPRYEQRIFYGDRLLVVVTLNGRHLPPAEVRATALSAGDRLELLLPVAGG
jgi:sulfur carrier protein ThiS